MTYTNTPGHGQLPADSCWCGEDHVAGRGAAGPIPVRPPIAGPSQPPSSRIYVINTPFCMHALDVEDELHDILERCGLAESLIRVYALPNLRGNKIGHRGAAILEFHSVAAAAKAGPHLDGHLFGGRIIRADYARDRGGA